MDKQENDDTEGYDDVINPEDVIHVIELDDNGGTDKIMLILVIRSHFG